MKNIFDIIQDIHDCDMPDDSKKYLLENISNKYTLEDLDKLKNEWIMGGQVYSGSNVPSITTASNENIQKFKVIRGDEIELLVHQAKALAKKRRISQGEMAKEMGIPRRTLEEWLQLRRLPKSPGAMLFRRWIIENSEKDSDCPTPKKIEKTPEKYINKSFNLKDAEDFVLEWLNLSTMEMSLSENYMVKHIARLALYHLDSLVAVNFLSIDKKVALQFNGVGPATWKVIEEIQRQMVLHLRF